jgi:hypothetical protein
MAHSYSVAVQPLLGGVVDAIETVVAGVPASRERAVEAPAVAVRRREPRRSRARWRCRPASSAC